MASVIIIFGSTSGNTEMVCKKNAQVLEDNGHEVKLQRAELSSPDEIQGHDLCILAASTYGHGIIQDHMIPFIKEFKKKDFASQKFAVIGLGDDKYDNHYNVESAYILEEAIKSVNGQIITEEPLMINHNPMWQLDQVKKWTESLAI